MLSMKNDFILFADGENVSAAYIFLNRERRLHLEGAFEIAKMLHWGETNHVLRFITHLRV
jgi:hypothetical protein